MRTFRKNVKLKRLNGLSIGTLVPDEFVKFSDIKYVRIGRGRGLWKYISNACALMLSRWVRTHVGRGLEIAFFAYVLNECYLIKIFLIYCA